MCGADKDCLVTVCHDQWLTHEESVNHYQKGAHIHCAHMEETECD